MDPQKALVIKFNQTVTKAQKSRVGSRKQVRLLVEACQVTGEFERADMALEFIALLGEIAAGMYRRVVSAQESKQAQQKGA